MRARGLSRSPSPFSYSSLNLTVQDSAEGLKKEVSRLRKRNKILVALSLIVVVLASLIVFSPLFLPKVKASLAQDGSGVAGALSSYTLNVSLTTSSSNDVIILVVGLSDGNGMKTSATRTSSPSLTWIGRKNITETVSHTAYIDLEEYYAVWSSSGTINITVTLSGTPNNYANATAFAISGADTSTIFDGTAQSANDGGSGSKNPTVPITTTNANDFIFGTLETFSAYTDTAGAGYTTIVTTGGKSSEYQIVSATQSGLAVNFVQALSFYWCETADAVMQASATTDYPPTYTTIGSNETIAGNPVKCYVLWVDNSSATSYFCFGTNNTGSWVNQTWTTVTSNWGNYSFTLNTTVGVKVQWEEWVNDTGGGYNNTGLQTITTTYYASITVNTGTHSWSINPAQNNVTITENSGKISLTVTSNAAFDIGAKASGDLTYGSYSISLTNTNMSATTWSVAIPLTTSYQTVPGLSNVGSGTGLSENVYLWLSCPTNKPAGAYTETITFEIIQTGGSY